jgi:hypothetical protein
MFSKKKAFHQIHQIATYLFKLLNIAVKSVKQILSNFKDLQEDTVLYMHVYTVYMAAFYLNNVCTHDVLHICIT